MKRDPTRSKRAIQRAAEQNFATQFNVICSKGDFSYVTHAIEYCEVSNRAIVSECKSYTLSMKVIL
ncbi:unnamed protein product [Brugia pahangi]|uniref:Ground-like domain-containing protein n=1 Tax=Brugia pahangi TaxID=6280 RepID=A0A0N4THB2_BRUPA|nr:unnamed protein product [Brugia pahangi]